MLLSIKQATRKTGISNSALCRYARDGKVPASKLGGNWVFEDDRLESWMETEIGKYLMASCRARQGARAANRASNNTTHERRWDYNASGFRELTGGTSEVNEILESLSESIASAITDAVTSSVDKLSADIQNLLVELWSGRTEEVSEEQEAL